MIDRFDLIIEVPEVTIDMIFTPKISETSHVIANCVAAAQAYAATWPIQLLDFANAQLQPDRLSGIDNFDDDAATLNKTAIEHSRLFARANHEIQQVARTIADLNAESSNSQTTIAEARAYWAMPFFA